MIIPPRSPDPDVLFPSLPPRLLTRFDSTCAYFNFVSSHCLLLVCAWVPFTVFAFHVLLLSLLPTRRCITARYNPSSPDLVSSSHSHSLPQGQQSAPARSTSTTSFHQTLGQRGQLDERLHSTPNDDTSTKPKIDCDWPIGLNNSTHHSVFELGQGKLIRGKTLPSNTNLSLTPHCHYLVFVFFLSFFHRWYVRRYHMLSAARHMHI